jgi:hypothetical protein
MRSFLLSLDTIVAISLLLLLTVFLSGLSFTYSSPELAYQRLYYAGKDLLNLMEQTRIESIQEFETVQYYLAEGILTDDDMNKTILDIIGSFWSTGNETYEDYAANLTLEFFNKTLPSIFGYEMLMDGLSIYRRNTSSENYIARLSTIASGYEHGKPVSGWVARAWAIEIRKNTTLIVMGDVISSSVRKPWGGNNQNKVNVTYNINLPDDANISKAWWFIETAWWDNRFKTYINGIEIPGGGGVGSKKLDNLEGYLHPGNNTATVVGRFGSYGYEAGDDGATHFVVVYNTTQFQTIEFPKRFHFQEVRSNCSINYKKPLFIIGNISSLNVRLNLSHDTQVDEVTLKFRWKGKEIEIGEKDPENGVVEWNNSEIQSILNANGINYSELSNRYFWFIVDVDEYHSREYKSYGRWIIHEDSYVEVDYTTSAPYGYIDITSEIPVTNYMDEDFAGFYRYVKWGFDMPSEAIPLDARWQFAWLYWSGSDPMQMARANDVILYHHDPDNESSDPLIIEFARFGYTPDTANGVLISGENKFELNFTQGYAVNPDNSMGASTVLLKNHVGYGEVNETEQGAIDDAIRRLNEMLGSFVTATYIQTDTSSIAGVPSLWGPARLEIRIWI